MDTVVNAIQSRIDDLLYDNACSFTQAAFVDVQNAFFYSAIQKQRYLFGKCSLALYRITVLTWQKYQAQDGLLLRT
jgi:hypothetical protein